MITHRAKWISDRPRSPIRFDGRPRAAMNNNLLIHVIFGLLGVTTFIA